MKKYLLFITALSLLWSDGSLWPPVGDYEVYSSSQVAVLKKIPDGEELSILVKVVWSHYYSGFAWIVPLPSGPQVQEIDEQIFTDLVHMSAPVYNGGGCSPFTRADYMDDATFRLGNDYIEVVSYYTIGFLDAVVLHTDHADSLVNWLSTNGYQIIDGAYDMLSDYIDRDWNYFFCARVDSALLETNYQNIGVKITFETDSLVYPMKISALSSPYYIEVFLYIIDHHKMYLDGAELVYANRVTSEEHDHITRDFPLLSEYLAPEDYVTKLKVVYTDPSDISSDIYPYQSPDDTEYQEFWNPYYGSVIFGNGFLLLLLAHMLYIGIKKIRRKKI